MSQRLISLSPDLRKLRDEGYDVEIRASHLVVRQVPYVNSRKEVAYGTLVSTLTMAGDRTHRPDTHVMHFAGEYPCTADGAPIRAIQHASHRQVLGTDLVVDHSFSSKPRSRGYYEDYYEKVTTYAAILSSPAQAIDSTVTARIYPVVRSDEGESVFQYLDTASSRAEIGAVTAKIEGQRVAIVGLGGTGSYVLDLVAKTPVREIHLFDGDVFSQHNAFRAPGAASAEELQARPQKVEYFRERYSKIHRYIYAHDGFLDAAGAKQLAGFDMVFVCMDSGEAKRAVLLCLEELGVAFIDVGMGVNLIDGALTGILRVTTSSDARRAHVWQDRISFIDGDGNNEYGRNIQVAELNALNATLAVIRWKKMVGFYVDLEREHHCTYPIDGNVLINEEQAA